MNENLILLYLYLLVLSDRGVLIEGEGEQGEGGEDKLNFLSQHTPSTWTNTVKHSSEYWKTQL